MGQCKDCRFYRPNMHDNGRGSCTHEKVSEGGYTYDLEKSKDPLIMGGGFDGYGDYLSMAPEFGCILFEE